MSQTIYVLDKEILRFLGLKSAVYNRFRSKACYNGESAVFSLQMKPCNCNIFFWGRQAGISISSRLAMRMDRIDDVLWHHIKK